jgi:hypothetical protein
MKAGASSGGSSGGVAVVAAAAAAVAAAAGAVLLTMSLRKRQRVTGCGERTKWAKGGERVWVVGNSTDGENIATPAQFCKAPIEPGSVDVIVVEDAASLLDENVLRALAKTLRGGGRAVVMGGDPRVVSSTLTLNGLKDCQPTSDGQAVVGYKPEWDVGTKALLKIPSARMPSSAPVAAAWKVNVTELAEDDLVDEDDLLNQSEAPPIRQNAGNGGGCDTKRRACKVGIPSPFERDLINSSSDHMFTPNPAGLYVRKG